MPVKDQKKPAPKAKAPIEEHKKHADEFLAKDEYKVPPGGYRPTDTAKE
jgi:hypothetical protein